MRRGKKLLLIGVAVVLIAAALFVICIGLVFFRGTPQGFSGFAMGSTLSGTVWVTGLLYPGLSGDFTWLVQELEEQLNAATEAPLEALLVMKSSGGAFNPYLGALTKLWNIDGKDGNSPCVPTDAEIFRALEKREVDLGAYGKGAACDAALDRVEAMYVKAAVVNLGGNIMTYGRKPWGRPFKIALRDPLGGPNDTIGVFTLRGTHFISTSGSYEKYFERDGKRYHHIFDPQTGYPAERDPGLISVTVITGGDRREAGSPTAGGGAIGDMLSTACFVLGYENSQELLQIYDCDGIFIYENGDVRDIGNVRAYFTLTSPAYHWYDEGGMVKR